jgi:hypothetical protein
VAGSNAGKWIVGHRGVRWSRVLWGGRTRSVMGCVAAFVPKWRESNGGEKWEGGTSGVQRGTVVEEGAPGR